jgi:hypothetical protein
MAFFFLVGWKFELKVSCLQSRYSTTWATLPVHLTQIFFLFIAVLGGGTLQHLQRFFQCIKYIILEFTPLLHSPPPISGTVSTSIIFAFTYICTHYLHCTHPPTLFPTPPQRNLFSNFLEEKT